MRAGTLRKRVTVQQPTVAQTGTGNAQTTWSTFAVAWADFSPQTGLEQIQAGQVNAKSPVNVNMRYLSGLNVAMRLVMGSRTFQIESVVNPDERNREINLVCVEMA